MSASPLPWMCSPRNSGIVTRIFCLRWKFRFRPSSEMRSVSSWTSVVRWLTTSGSISRVAPNFPGRTSRSTGAMRSILVNPETLRVGEPARAGRPSVQAVRRTGTNLMPVIRASRGVISRGGGRPGLPGQRLEEPVEHREGRAEAGEPGGEQGLGVSPGAPEVLGGAVDPVAEPLRAQLGVELDPHRAAHAVPLGGVGLPPEERAPRDGLEGVAVPVNRVEGLRKVPQQGVVGG